MAQARVLKPVMCQQLRCSSVLTAVQKGWSHSPVPFSRGRGERLSIEEDLNAHAGIRSLENAVLAELPYLGSSGTLGCEFNSFFFTSMDAVWAWCPGHH